MSASVGIRFAISLALVAALGPVSVDMYLASMPAMATEFNVSYAAIQLTLSIYLACLGIGQLFFGPLTDALGRRIPMLVGIVGYLGAAAVAAVSTNLEMLIAARIVQGLGAAVAIVAVMSMVRDVASEEQATKLYAVLNTIVALGPIAAPVAGGFISVAYGWQGVMWCMALVGVLVFINSTWSLPESLSQDKRTDFHLKTIAANYVMTLRNRILMVRMLTISVILIFVFNYIAGSSYVYQHYFGMSADQFGMVFSITSLSLIVGASSVAVLLKFFKQHTLMYAGAMIMMLGGFMCIAAEFFGWGLIGLVVGLAIAVFAIGILEATLMSSAMNSQETSLGVAAALLGALPLMLGALGTVLAGILVEIGALPWIISLALFGPVVVVLIFIGNRLEARKKTKTETETETETDTLAAV